MISEYALPDYGGTKKGKKSDTNRESFSSGVETDKNRSKTKSSSKGRYPMDGSERNTSKTRGYDDQESEFNISEEVKKRLKFPKPLTIKGIDDFHKRKNGCEKLLKLDSEKKKKKTVKKKCSKSGVKEETSLSRKSKSKERKSAKKIKAAQIGTINKSDKKTNPLGLAYSRKSAPHTNTTNLERLKDPLKINGLKKLGKVLNIETDKSKNISVVFGGHKEVKDRLNFDFLKKKKTSVLIPKRISVAISSRANSRTKNSLKNSHILGSRSISKDNKKNVSMGDSRSLSKSKKSRKKEEKKEEDPLGSYFGDIFQRKTSKKIGVSKRNKSKSSMIDNLSHTDIQTSKHSGNI